MSAIAAASRGSLSLSLSAIACSSSFSSSSSSSSCSSSCTARASMTMPIRRRFPRCTVSALRYSSFPSSFSHLPPREMPQRLGAYATGGVDKASTSTSACSSSSSSSSNKRRQHALVAALASAGALETAYLTAAKLTHMVVACTAAGAASRGAAASCGEVLDSPFATLFGSLPLPAVGFAAYAAVAAAAAKLAVSSSSSKEGKRSSSSGSGSSGSGGGSCGNNDSDDDDDEEANNGLAASVVAAGAGALGAASLSLAFLLTGTDAFSGASCAWCCASAALSASIVAATFLPMTREERGKAATPALSGALTSVSALVLSWSLSGLLAFGPAGPAIAAGGQTRDFELPFAEPEVTRLSSPRALGLARALRESGAQMFGAFWCSHCFEQKQAFGIAAQAALPYVECYPDGFRRDTRPAPVCVAAGVEGFPSWKVGGKMYEGEKTFDELEEALKRAQAKGAIAKAVDSGAGREGRLAEAPALR